MCLGLHAPELVGGSLDSSFASPSVGGAGLLVTGARESEDDTSRPLDGNRGAVPFAGLSLPRRWMGTYVADPEGLRRVSREPRSRVGGSRSRDGSSRGSRSRPGSVRGGGAEDPSAAESPPAAFLAASLSLQEVPPGRDVRLSRGAVRSVESVREDSATAVGGARERRGSAKPARLAARRFSTSSSRCFWMAAFSSRILCVC